MFAGAYDSFITQKPSRHSIETVEQCQVLSISYQAFQELFVRFPGMNEFVRKVLEERFVALHELFTAQILDSPEERYINLQKNRPDLINRIPQHQIATFLGITPVSLSRIRNRLARK
jgi:CRP-like cAMP-binding protein